MSGGLRALAHLRLAVRCSSDGEVAFHTQRKGTSEAGGSPRCPPRAGRANGSAGVRWAASDLPNYFFLHPGTADRELAAPFLTYFGGSLTIFRCADVCASVRQSSVPVFDVFYVHLGPP